jgi:hypothetical protein
MSNKMDGAMLTTLTIRKWQAKCRDREVLSFVENHYEAKKGNMSLVKKLVPDFYVRPINFAAQTGRQEHYKYTVPGIRQGMHLLSTELWEEYVTKQRVIKKSFFDAVDIFLENYDLIIEDAPRLLGKTFKESDFPSKASVRAHFDYDLQFLPVPDIHDWRLQGIENDEVEQIKASVRDDVEAMYQDATAELINRATDMMDKLYEQIVTFDPKTGGAKLRDATIEHAREIARLTVDMNITKDPDLDSAGKQMMEQLEGVESESLRTDPVVRKSLAASFQKLSAQLKSAEK